MRSRIALLVLILAALFASQRGTFSSQNSAERLSVIDGDTLQVDGAIVQLYGIDAPELGQLCESDNRLWPCGVDAALALSKLVSLNRSSLRCAPWSGQDRAGPEPARSLQVCQVGNEVLAVLMLDSGNGLALPQAFPDYVDAERQARDAALGMWHSDFVVPWEWREGVRSPQRRSDSSRDCNVKGVFGAAGQRLYFVPTDADYGALTIDPNQGERVFCSDEEARLAGWRRIGEKSSAGK
jgi:endonuclease YncB( thermonuclease family)